MSNTTVVQRYFPLTACVSRLYQGVATVPSPSDPHDDTKNLTYNYSTFHLSVYDEITDRFPDEWMYFSFMWLRTGDPSRLYFVTADSQVGCSANMHYYQSYGLCEVFVRFSVTHRYLSIISTDPRIDNVPFIRAVSPNAVKPNDYVVDASSSYSDPVDWIVASVRNYSPLYGRAAFERANAPRVSLVGKEEEPLLPCSEDLFSRVATL